MKEISIFIYNDNGELIKEYFFSDFVETFNIIISHNMENKNEKWNLINGYEFPPHGLIWNNSEKNWSKKNNEIFKSNNFSNLIDFFK
jgi:hypothetical protein